MTLEIRSFDPGQTTGYFEATVTENGIECKAQREVSGHGTHLGLLYNLVAKNIWHPEYKAGNIEICFEDWRTFPGGPPYSKVIAKEVIGVIKVACVIHSLGWREYMPATKSLIQDKHLKALDLWHSSKHVRDATKIALVHLHRFHRELFDAIMKEVL